MVEGSKILREYRITPGRIEGHGRPSKPVIAEYPFIPTGRSPIHEIEEWVSECLRAK